MKTILICLLIASSPVLAFWFFLLVWERGGDGAWVTFERFVDDVFSEKGQP